MAKKKTGTREWAEVNLNIITGCEHRCRYCYAADMAKRFHRIASFEEWGNPQLRPKEVGKDRKKCRGRIMFPTTHDITPQFIEECVTVLKKLLAAGNEVLIVTKPHLACVERLCRELAAYKGKIVFRFTIGAMDEELLRYWEPGAPSFAERLAALMRAHDTGFRTSVSAEPMLDVPHAVELYEAVVPFVTDTIWFGKLNMIRKRVEVKTPEDEAAVQRIEENQTDERIVELYERLKDKPKVAWKDSIRELVGLPPVENVQ
jgi:DNA repair photolyase